MDINKKDLQNIFYQQNNIISGTNIMNFRINYLLKNFRMLQVTQNIIVIKSLIKYNFNITDNDIENIDSYYNNIKTHHNAIKDKICFDDFLQFICISTHKQSLLYIEYLYGLYLIIYLKLTGKYEEIKCMVNAIRSYIFIGRRITLNNIIIEIYKSNKVILLDFLKCGILDKVINNLSISYSKIIYYSDRFCLPRYIVFNTPSIMYLIINIELSNRRKYINSDVVFNMAIEHIDKVRPDPQIICLLVALILSI